jgi:23S rRNA (adenine2503-C2)-methyltransferase
MANTLLGMDTEELRALMQELGEPAYRGNQLAEWLYRSGARSLDEMTNLPDTMRQQLGERCRVGRSRVVTSRHSKDGTVKLLLEMSDGARIETVGLPYSDRLSCCISTQAGCPIGCIFCATGRGGFTRNLTAGEIVEQVLAMQEAIRSQPLSVNRGSGRIDHVTFMGMGEPLLNYEATVKAIRLLSQEMGIAMRHLTVSTVGFVPGIRRLMEERLQLTLSVSLHAPTDELRRRLIPRMKRWSVVEIIDACREYAQRTGRRVTFEYCLLNDINDSVVTAGELVKLLHGLNCHVNLIPFNPVSGLSFSAPPRKTIQAFRAVLESAGIQVTQRFQRGSGIDAACGQLRHHAAMAGQIDSALTES